MQAIEDGVQARRLLMPVCEISPFELLPQPVDLVVGFAKFRQEFE
jgi:hypothetical protein